MEFNEEKAKEIIGRFELNPTTLKVWKNRGSIPDKYFREGFTKTDAMDKDMKHKLSRIKYALDADVFNLNAICRIAEVPYGTFFDALREKGNISQDDLDKVILEFKRIKTFIMNHIKFNNPQKLKTLFENPELKFYVINGKETFGKRMYDSLKKGNIISESDYMLLKDNYMKVYIRINF